MTDTHSSENLAGALMRAEQAREEGDPAVWKSWLELAKLEAEALLLTDAFEHALRGIALFERPKKNHRSYDTCFNFSCAVDIAQAFANAGDDLKAESLLKAATEKIEVTYGNTGPHYAFQNACLAVYHFGRNSQDKAMHHVELALKCPARSLQLQIGSVVAALDQCQATLIAKEELEAALEICTKIIDKQSSEIASDDARLAISLLDRAKILMAMHRSDNAVNDYRRAFAILKLYGSASFEVRDELRSLSKLLHESGREDEARESEAQIEELLRHKSYQSGAAKMPAKSSEPLEKIQQLRKALEYARQEHPYGERARFVATWLLPLAQSQEDWNLVRETAEILCSHYEHTNDYLIGERGGGCILESLQRFDFYQSLVQANLQLKDVSSAVANLHRAEICIPEISYYENLGFAVLSKECGEVSLAKKFATKAEPLVLEEFYLFQNQSQLSDIWNQLGEPERAAIALRNEEKVIAFMQGLRGR